MRYALAGGSVLSTTGTGGVHTVEHMSFTVTAIVIAVLAGLGAYAAWSSNKALSLGLAALTALAGALGVIGAFLWALGVVFKLLPLALLAFGVWLIYRNVTREDADRTPTRSFREVK